MPSPVLSAGTRDRRNDVRVRGLPGWFTRRRPGILRRRGVSLRHPSNLTVALRFCGAECWSHDQPRGGSRFRRPSARSGVMFRVHEHLYLSIEENGTPTAQTLAGWDAGAAIPAHVVGNVVAERQVALDRAAEMTKWLAKVQTLGAA